MTTIPTIDEIEGRAEQLPLIEAHATPLVDFYLGTSFTCQALEEDLLRLAGYVMDLRKMHTAKRAVSMKLCADDIAKLSGQISNLSAHLAGATEKFVNRKPRNGSAT